MAPSSSAATPDLDSPDPYRVLGIDKWNGGADADAAAAKEVKRAYRKLALQYHPDVATTKDSSDAEKKAASEAFAKINWAYDTIKNKKAWNSGSPSSAASGGGGGSSSAWEPPHRRKGYSRATSGNRATSDGYAANDWRSYMPNFGRDGDDDDGAYDTNGDSFQKILSDLFAGAAVAGMSGAAGGGRGILNDFVEFLEQTVDGYGGSAASDDAELRVLLQTAGLDEMGAEMEETELVVQQLSHKIGSIDDEVRQVQVQAANAGRYMDKIELQERADELVARKAVAEGYLKRARKRLVAIQTRYKELIMTGGARRGDKRGGDGGGTSRSTWDDIKGEASSSSAAASPSSRAASPSPSSSSSTRSNEAPGGAGPSSTTSSSSSSFSTSASQGSDESWRTEGFGSFGRGRGSSRRSRSRPSATDTATSPSSSSSSDSRDAPYRSTVSEPPRREYSSSTSSQPQERSAPPTRQQQQQNPATDDPYVPPHRRKQQQQTAFSQQQENEKRLREIKVDEEFEKLKKDLGL
jgi:DnaJ domain